MNYFTRSAASLTLSVLLAACGSEKPSLSAESASPQNETIAQSNTEISQSESKVSIAPVPTWIKSYEVPEYPPARIDQARNGIEYLLIDDQYRHFSGGFEYSSRLAFRVSDRKGLETAAQVKASFDPTLSQFVFNFIKVTRDGKTVDRLPSVEIREIQQESGLGSGIIDGDITALINLEDVRVGDIVDYSYSAKVQTPLYPEMFFASSSSSYSVPVARKVVSYDMPRDKRLYTDTIETDGRVKITDEGDRTIYTIDLIDPDPHREYKNIPDGVVTQGSFQVSTANSWEEIADWAVEVYNIDLDLPKQAKAKIKSIRKDNKTDGDRALAALRWVQDDIRYLGYEEGVNGHKPRTPSATLANGYGDCKDKSLLLKTALSEMGITSYVTLASTTMGDLLDQVLPSIGMFNHAIVMAEIDGQNVFMDPTGTYQRGTLEAYGEPDYGFVLPIKAGVTELVKVEIPFEAYPLQTTIEQYTYQDDGQIALNIESIYNKQYADSMRRKLAQQGVSKLTQSYHDYYAELYPGLEVSANIQVSDDEKLNQIIFAEAYILDADIVKNAKYDENIEVKAYSISGKLPDFIEPGRNFPLALKQGVKLRHEIQIITPGREFPDQEDVIEKVSGIDFTLDYEAKDDIFSLAYDLSISEDRVSLTEATKVVDLAAKIESLASRNVNLKAAQTPLYERLGLGTPIDPNTLNEIQAIGTLIASEENVDALERVRKLSQSYKKKDALRGLIQQLQAGVLINLGRENAALPLLEEAFSLFDPLDQATYFTYAGLQNGKEDYAGAADTMIRVFKTHPESAKGLRMEWVWALYRNLEKNEQFELTDNFMISLAKAQLENLDDIDSFDRVFGTAILAMGRQGQVEEAKSLYPYIYDASTFRDILMDREMQALWDDASELAGEGLAKARQAEVDHASELVESEDAGYQDYSTLIAAYLGNGQSPEAVAFAKPIFENWDRLIAEGTDGFWFANAYATALDQNGNYDESNAVYDKLMSIGVAQEGDLVSMAINQLVTQVGRRDFQKALDKVEIYLADEDFSVSDYGRSFLFYVKACSQYKLGQTNAANVTFDDEFLPIADSNPGVKTLTLACLNRDDELAEALIARMENKAERSGTISIFVEDTVPLFPDSFTIEQLQHIRKISSRADVKKVFDKYGRSISIKGPSEIWSEF